MSPIKSSPTKDSGFERKKVSQSNKPRPLKKALKQRKIPKRLGEIKSCHYGAFRLTGITDNVDPTQTDILPSSAPQSNTQLSSLITTSTQSGVYSASDSIPVLPTTDFDRSQMLVSEPVPTYPVDAPRVTTYYRTDPPYLPTPSILPSQAVFPNELPYHPHINSMGNNLSPSPASQPNTLLSSHDMTSTEVTPSSASCSVPVLSADFVRPQMPVLMRFPQYTDNTTQIATHCGTELSYFPTTVPLRSQYDPDFNSPKMDNIHPMANNPCQSCGQYQQISGLVLPPSSSLNLGFDDNNYRYSLSDLNGQHVSSYPSNSGVSMTFGPADTPYETSTGSSHSTTMSNYETGFTFLSFPMGQ